MLVCNTANFVQARQPVKLVLQDTISKQHQYKNVNLVHHNVQIAPAIARTVRHALSTIIWIRLRICVRRVILWYLCAFLVLWTLLKLYNAQPALVRCLLMVVMDVKDVHMDVRCVLIWVLVQPAWTDIFFRIISILQPILIWQYVLLVFQIVCNVIIIIHVRHVQGITTSRMHQNSSV